MKLAHEVCPRKGRPRLASAVQDMFIRVTSLRIRQLTAPQIRAYMNVSESSLGLKPNLKLSCSEETVLFLQRNPTEGRGGGGSVRGIE